MPFTKKFKASSDPSDASHAASGETRRHDPTRPEAPTKTWQPSALDAGTSSYSGASAGRSQIGRPAPIGTLSRPSGFRRSLLWLTVTAGIVVAAFLIWRSQLPAGLGEPVAVLEVARGPVSLQPVSVLAAGAPVAAGAVVETGGEGGVALRLRSGHSVRLDADSRVRVTSASVLDLERGAVYVDSRSGLTVAQAAAGRATASVEVRTTLGIVRDIGTQFEVRLHDADLDPAAATLRVRVREGRVEVRPASTSAGADGTDVQVVAAGAQLQVRASGEVERTAIPVHGEAWDWVLRTAPVPAIEGQRLQTFLDWVTREGGWQLEFVDTATAEQAASVVLHGDVADLTLTEAAATVLRGSSLQYRLEAGSFVVGRQGR